MQIPHLLSYMEIRGFSHFSWNRDLSLRVCIAENFTSISYVSMCMAKKFASVHKYAKTRISKSHGYENHENEDFQQPKSSRTYNCETCVFQDTGKLMRNPKDLIAMHDLRLLGSQYIKRRRLSHYSPISEEENATTSGALSLSVHPIRINLKLIMTSHL